MARANSTSPTTPEIVFHAVLPENWYPAVTANRNAAVMNTAAGTSLLSPAATPMSNIATALKTRNNASASLVDPGGDVYITKPVTSHVSASTHIAELTTTSRASVANTDARN